MATDLLPTTLIIHLGTDHRQTDPYKDMSLKCARCGCSNNDACVGGCSWVLPGLCSACAPYVSAVTVTARVPGGMQSTREILSKVAVPTAAEQEPLPEKLVPAGLPRTWPE